MTKIIFASLGSGLTVGGTGGTALSTAVATTASGSTPQRVTITQPAAGQEWSLTLPTAGQSLNLGTGALGSGTLFPNGCWLRVLSGNYSLAIDQAVAVSRYIGWKIADETSTLFYENENSAAITNAVSSQKITVGPNGSNGGGGVANDGVRIATLSLYGGIILQPGWTISSATPNTSPSQTMVGTDRYSKIELWFEMWTTQPVYDPYGPLLI